MENLLGDAGMSEKTVRIGAVALRQRLINAQAHDEIKGVVCPAVCDVYEDRMNDGIEIVKNSPHYSGYEVKGYLDYKEMFEKEQLTRYLSAPHGLPTPESQLTRCALIPCRP